MLLRHLLQERRETYAEASAACHCRDFWWVTVAASSQTVAATGQWESIEAPWLGLIALALGVLWLKAGWVSPDNCTVVLAHDLEYYIFEISLSICTCFAWPKLY